MTRPLLLVPILLALSLSTSRPSFGIELILSTGGRVEGELLNPDQDPRENYIVRGQNGGIVMLLPGQVQRLNDRTEALAWYQEALSKMQQTVEGHWEIAEACREHGLKPQRLFHLEEILKLDPEHKQARYGLGYSKVDGKWVKTDEWNRAQGYVRAGGSWRLPQDVALENQARKAELREKEWIRKVKTWKTWIEKQRGSERAGIQQIRAIRDPLAAKALIQIIENEKERPDIRRLCIDVLGELRTAAGVKAFVERAVEDSDPNIRDACLNELTRFGRLQAARSLEALLASPDNIKVNRAGRALAVLKVPETTLSLINALVTKHKYLIPSSGGGPGRTTTSFGSGPGGGGNSFGVGGRPKVIEQPRQNQGVLDALVAIHPGTNFGYDIDAWKKWYIQKHTPPIADLRRDP